METLYCHISAERKGGPLGSITRLLRHFHGVKCVINEGQKKGVYLGHNILREGVSSRMRKVIFLGGARPRDHGIPRDFAWNEADHIVFCSHFFRNIAKSRYKIKRSSVIHLVGGAPPDIDMIPVPSFAKSFTPDDEINFMMCAKWSKRYFKRYSQHVQLFLNYIKKEYPNSRLHVVGKKMEQNRVEGDGIISYRKDFHGRTVVDVYKQSDIQLILTPFDAGPKTASESLHYRVPFICGNNSAGDEFISRVDGKCGSVVKIDPQIKNARHCKKYRPMTNKKFYGRKLNNELIMTCIHNMIQNYSDYVSWQWTEEFNYKVQAQKWMNVLFGE